MNYFLAGYDYTQHWQTFIGLNGARFSKAWNQSQSSLRPLEFKYGEMYLIESLKNNVN